MFPQTPDQMLEQVMDTIAWQCGQMSEDAARMDTEKLLARYETLKRGFKILKVVADLVKQDTAEQVKRVFDDAHKP